jgi:hypothetical protein
VVQQESPWISVLDKTPDVSGWYFTCIEEMCGVPQCVGVTYFDAELEEWSDLDDEYTEAAIEYWMPIPRIFKNE